MGTTAARSGNSMKEQCQNCEFKGYSRELCVVHRRHCSANPGRASKPTPAPVKIGAKVLVGAGLGVVTVVLGSAAVSLVGGAALLNAILLKIGAGAGLAGGGIGLFKGLSAEAGEKKKERAIAGRERSALCSERSV